MFLTLHFAAVSEALVPLHGQLQEGFEVRHRVYLSTAQGSSRLVGAAALRAGSSRGQVRGQEL